MSAVLGWASWRGGALLVALALAGCATDQAKIEKALLADRNPAAHSSTAASQYVVECPDRVEVSVEGDPTWTVPCEIGADGRIDLPEVGRVRVGEQTVGDAARSIARALRVPVNRVHVRVTDYRSQQIFIYGEVAGVQRAVAYRGPETVTEILQRAGGIAPGAAPGNIQVLRGHIADGRAPEVFPIDLEAIVLKNDQQTNIRIEPFDQIYIGESRRGVVQKCMPPLLQPLYQKLMGLSRGQSSNQPAAQGQPSPAPSGPPAKP
jgi:protein involved in polysaccharide export with SLBB domain